MQKRLLAGVIGTTLLLGLGTGALAASSLEEIKAYLNGEIKFKVNGADWRPSDEKGNEMMPITYNGNTYVPLRSVSTALNTPIDYDGESQTVVLGEKVDGMSLFSKDVKLNSDFVGTVHDIVDKEQLILSGKQYNGAFRYKATTQQGYIDINLGKSFSKMNAVVGVKGEGGKFQVVSSKTDQVLKEFTLTKDEVKEVEIGLQNNQNIKFKIVPTGKEDKNFYLFKESVVK